MTDLGNPYSAPEAALAKGPIASEAENRDGITSRTKDYVAKAGPWAKFLGILGFIVTGLFVLLSIGLIIFSGWMPAALGQSMPFLGDAFGAARAAIGVVYLLSSLLFFFPSLFLVNCGAASRRYRLGGDPADLERFMLGIKKLAKFFGIVAIVVIAIYAVVFLVMIISAVATGA